MLLKSSIGLKLLLCVGVVATGFLIVKWWPFSKEPSKHNTDDTVFLKKNSRTVNVNYNFVYVYNSFGNSKGNVHKSNSSCKKYCSLCLEGIKEENMTKSSEIYCKKCYSLSEKFKDEVEEIYCNKEKVKCPEDKTTPSTPISVRHNSLSVHNTPSVKHYVHPSKIDPIFRWADRGLETFTTKTDMKSMTHESLLKFISSENIETSPERQSAFAQGIYMAWLHKRALACGKTKHRTRTLVLKDPDQMDSDMYSVLSDKFCRSLIRRMKILRDKKSLSDPRVYRVTKTRMVTKEDCEYKEKETGLTLVDLIVHDIYMGWPCFLDGKEADDYLALMPPSHRKVCIKDQSSKPVFYVVWDLPE